jgi:type IV pilus assembly protein PilO
MTSSGGFSPGGDGFDAPSYPTVFGVTFTPTVTGAAIAILGLGLAAYATTQLVFPGISKFQQLQEIIAQKQADLEQKEQTALRVNQIVGKLNQAKAENASVRSLFSTQQAIDTLLLDLNREIRGSQANLLEFIPNYDVSGIVSDGSLGEPLNNKLKRQVTSVSFEGTFSQTLAIMQAIDRLKTVLVVRDLSLELQKDNQEESNRPSNLVTSKFQLYAYVPLTPEEAAAAQAASDKAKQAEEAEKKGTEDKKDEK